ncbi:hypothetical protein [Dokdonella soli]|uniref:hypothetical protein n=1 Tax=Dokdonella soli TaxID=529810 RepID=UPI0036D28F96
MTARSTLRLIAFAGIGALACAAEPARAFDWQVEITPGSELFPALQLSQGPRAAPASAFGNGDGLISVRIHGADLPTALRLRVETAGLREPAVVEATRGAAGEVIELHPRLDWDVAQLRRLRGARRQPMRITLDGAGLTPQTRTLEVRLHPLDDAMYFAREGRDRVDLGWVFAAYVNPRDPVVDEVLEQARAIDPAFDADVVPHTAAADLRRAGAVWTALERHDLRYAGGDPALSRGPSLWSQRVRLPGDVWRDRRANCIDGSVLIASVFERIGIHPFIVLVPGHAFVGFRGDSGRGDAQYLETTLLGARLARSDSASGGVSAPGIGAASFTAALAAGRARWRKVAAKFDGRHRPDYALIDIGTARAYGIIPLAVDADATMAAQPSAGARQHASSQMASRCAACVAPPSRPQNGQP